MMDLAAWAAVYFKGCCMEVPLLLDFGLQRSPARCECSMAPSYALPIVMIGY